MKVWTKAMEAILREHWRKKTAQEIADLIGTVTRKAVIGKADRLDLPAANKPAKPIQPVNLKKPAPIRHSDGIKPPPRFSQYKDEESFTPKLMPLSQTQAHHCRFPYGDSAMGRELTVCGHTVRQEGQSFCETHHAVCYNKITRAQYKDLQRLLSSDKFR